MPSFDDWSREDLIKLIEIHAKNWLAHDGCWFLAAEKTHGLEAAIRLDELSWEKFTVVEARRIMETFSIQEGGGLDSLARALEYRLYATINVQEIERPSPDKLIFTMVDCRVQTARRRKKLADFPCKSVGIIEYSGFARTIDPRIETRCLHCPPDEGDKSIGCRWEFTLSG